MTAVLLVIHVLIAIALVAVILLQRSEGGALGIGGGGGGGFMSARGAGNALTKATAILATAFFATSIGLTVIQSTGQPDASIVDQIQEREGEEPVPAEPEAPTVPLSD